MSEIKVVPCRNRTTFFIDVHGTAYKDRQGFVIYFESEAEALAKKAELEAIENFVAEPMLAESPYICDNPLCEHPQGKHSALRCHVEDCSCMYFATSRPAANLPVQTRPPAPPPDSEFEGMATDKEYQAEANKLAPPDTFPRTKKEWRKYKRLQKRAILAQMPYREAEEWADGMVTVQQLQRTDGNGQPKLPAWQIDFCGIRFGGRVEKAQVDTLADDLRRHLRKKLRHYAAQEKRAMLCSLGFDQKRGYTDTLLLHKAFCARPSVPEQGELDIQKFAQCMSDAIWHSPSIVATEEGLNRFLVERLTTAIALAASRSEAQPPDWDKVGTLLERWEKVWEGDKGKLLTEFPQWIVDAAAELFAHDVCDKSNWIDYTRAAAAIISRHAGAPAAGSAERELKDAARMVVDCEILTATKFDEKYPKLAWMSVERLREEMTRKLQDALAGTHTDVAKEK